MTAQKRETLADLEINASEAALPSGLGLAASSERLSAAGRKCQRVFGSGRLLPRRRR